MRIFHQSAHFRTVAGHPRTPAAAEPASPAAHPGSRLRQVLAAVLPTILVLAAAEAVLRVGAAIGHGGSPYYLFYGFHGLAGRVDISPWSVFEGGYYKFPPRYVLRGAAGMGPHDTASINALGFRGRDFAPRKPPGTVRIICLGGSSTFGFHDSDTGTYPYLLQRLLDRRRLGSRVEVINAGFPYYTTGNVRSLLEQELVRYDPDLLTLYSAFNDIGWPFEISPVMRSLGWLQRHSIIYLLLKQYVVTDRTVYRGKKVADWLQGRPSAEAIDSEAARIAARYRTNVEAIAAFARRNGMRLVLIRQPMTASQQGPEAFPSYEDEVAFVRQKLAQGGRLSARERALLVHRRLIHELDRIARENRLPVVDNIRIVDQDRGRLTTWVHLTEEANLRLAEALARVVTPLIPLRTGRADS
jgi:lysophospholipase L1-like esterase